MLIDVKKKRQENRASRALYDTDAEVETAEAETAEVETTKAETTETAEAASTEAETTRPRPQGRHHKVETTEVEAASTNKRHFFAELGRVIGDA
jgi:hypothetical protein